MDTTLDARGLACPLPAVKARRALAAVPPGGTLVVLATDPEAPITWPRWRSTRARVRRGP